MPNIHIEFEIDDQLITEAKKSKDSMDKLERGVAPLMKKINDGRIGTEKQVLESGLSADDVELLLKMNEKCKELYHVLDYMKRTFDQSMRDQKIEIEIELKKAVWTLNEEHEKASRRFPHRMADRLVSAACEEILKKALPKLKAK